MQEKTNAAPSGEAVSIEDELERHGVYASVTRGVSMRPLFKTHRDVVIIEKITRPLRKYDVVLYIGGSNKYTLHRIIRVGEDELIIRGDNTYKKEHVKRSEIIGILTEFNRKGKHGTVDSFSFKLYSRVWHYLYPVRRFFVAILTLAGKIKHKLFGKNQKKTV